ncbi:hypothetical protein N8878_05430, partial [Psychromonas sp.]|nr:hypothetical protein [Psychromonas sp.]
MLKTTKQKSKKETAFSKKWAQVEKKQKRNLNFKNKVIKFNQQFEKDILPSEIKLCEMIAAETRHLMSFIPRKSFTKWQREELITWIESNIDALAQHPFTPDDLAQTVDQEYAKYFKDDEKIVSEDEAMDPDNIQHVRNLLAELDIEDELSDEQIAEFIQNPETFSDFIEKELAERDKFDDEDEFDEDDSLFDEMEDDYFNGDFEHSRNSQQK